MGTDVTYKPKTIADIFIVPTNVIPWRKLIRKDVIVLKIEFAQSYKVGEQWYKGKFIISEKIEWLENATQA